VFILSVVAALNACATTAPSYTPNLADIEVLEESGLRMMGVGSFTSANPDLEKLTIRGGQFSSPYGGSFAGYLRNALQVQLEMAGLWDEASPATINGVLQKNHLDGSGMNIGVADLAAEFVLTVDESEVYREVHSIHHEWDSSFAGPVAIPRAGENYAVAVQKLLSELLTDPDFVRTALAP